METSVYFKWLKMEELTSQGCLYIVNSSKL